MNRSVQHRVRERFNAPGRTLEGAFASDPSRNIIRDWAPRSLEPPTPRGRQAEVEAVDARHGGAAERSKRIFSVEVLGTRGYVRSIAVKVHVTRDTRFARELWGLHASGEIEFPGLSSDGAWGLARPTVYALVEGVRVGSTCTTCLNT